jgi:hypothetical protein
MVPGEEGQTIAVAIAIIVPEVENYTAVQVLTVVALPDK